MPTLRQVASGAAALSVIAITFCCVAVVILTVGTVAIIFF